LATVAGGPKPATAAPAGSPSRQLDPRVGALVADPKLQALYLAAKRSRLDRIYDPLFKSLSLSPDQVDRFKAILLRREEQALDLVSAVPAAVQTNSTAGQWFDTSLGLGVGGPSSNADVRAAKRLMTQADQSFQSAAADLLGADGYQQFTDYERALPMRTIAEDTASALATSENPLNPDQINQLTQTLAQASAAFVRGQTANLNMTQVNWTDAIQQAQTFLTPSQLTAFKTTVATRRAADNLYSLVRTAAAGP
jgi:hypothetical protein